jgi:hypothetical protein
MVFSMILLFHTTDIFIWGFDYKLGRVRRDLNELKADGLLCNEVSGLAKLGYQYQYGIGADERLQSLAAVPFAFLLKQCPSPQAFVFHHSYAESAALPCADQSDAGFMPHAQYFPASLLREFNLDHIPYLGSFASGCTGLHSLIMTASGLCAFSSRDPVICLTADIKPAGTTYDALREKILTTDCSSGFVMGREKCGYQLLGISYYSSKRLHVPLVEIVKQTVQMVRSLTKALGVDGDNSDLIVHYPNIFPGAWDMVSKYLQIPRASHVMDGFADRAHCLSSDSIISLAARHCGQSGRLHVVVSFGSGLHLGVGIFREEDHYAPAV